MTVNGNIQANISGDISGQVAVGNYILQVGNVNGGVVNVAPPSSGPKYTKRTTPVSLRPRPFPSLLDRDDETATVQSGLLASVPISIYGPAGVGKTSLLRRLSHLSDVSTYTDGVAYLSVSEYGRDDILQAVFDAFFEGSSNFKATDTEIKVALQNLKALILIDDLSLKSDDVSSLLDAAPNCTFILASLERTIWGEGQLVQVGGLPEDDAAALFTRELGRGISDAEQDEIREVCAKLDGHPLRIIQFASLVREGKSTLADIKEQVGESEPDKANLRAVLPTLTESQKRVLAILASLEGNTIPEIHLATLSQTKDLQQDIKTLMSLGLVQAHSPRYSLAGNLPASLGAIWDLSSWEDVLINYFVNWLAQQPAEMFVKEAQDSLVHSIKKAGEKKRWKEVVQIGRVLEQILVLWRRWQTWMDVLDLVLKAARELGNRKVEAWALHQLGTRAACLGINEQAKNLLTQALNLRQIIGDQAGLAITQHNMQSLFGITPPPMKGKGKGCRRWFTYGAVGVGGLAVLGVLFGAGWFLFSILIPASTPAPTPIVVTRVVSATPHDTPTARNTFTPNPTGTSTYTPSPTVTPSNTPRPVVINFWSKDELILAGDCTFLEWDVRFANRVYLNGNAVDFSDSDSVCPKSTTTYNLNAESDSGPAQEQVTVMVIEPYPPPGYSPPLGCYPWSYSDGVTYYEPTMGCSRSLDLCYKPGAGCGKVAADAGGKLYTPYSAASSWVEGNSVFSTRYIGTGNNCFGSSCVFFESITCDFTR